MSQLFHGLHTQTFHPLSMFGMLWIDMYDSVFQLPPISSNFAVIEEWDNIPQASQQPDQLYVKEMCHAA